MTEELHIVIEVEERPDDRHINRAISRVVGYLREDAGVRVGDTWELKP